MSCSDFEPTIPVFERAKNVHALDGATTLIGPSWEKTAIFELMDSLLAICWPACEYIHLDRAAWRGESSICSQLSNQASLLATERRPHCWTVLCVKMSHMCWHFEGTCCLQLQGRNALNMNEVGSSQTLDSVYQVQGNLPQRTVIYIYHLNREAM
jgi:hypothetical protein